MAKKKAKQQKAKLKKAQQLTAKPKPIKKPAKKATKKPPAKKRPAKTSKATKPARSAKQDGEKFVGPLMNGRIDELKALLASGVHPDAPRQHGDTALQLLADYGPKQTAESARLLIEAGANVNVKSASTTVLMRACQRGVVPLVKALLQAGADAKTQDSMNMTALFHAAECDNSGGAECVRLLLAAGLDPNEKWIHPNRGVMAGTPISHAAESGKPDAVRALLEAGADPNVIGGFAGWVTPLTSAIEEKKADNVAILLEGGADPHLRIPADHPAEELAGLTALELARKKKLKAIVALLENAGKPGKKAAAVPPRPADVATVWKQLEKAVRAVDPKVQKSLLPGASQAQLAALERTLGVTLPDELKKSYQIHNGQKTGADGLVPSSFREDEYVLLSLAEIANEWKMWKKLTDAGEFRERASAPDAGVQGDWWNPGWIPFAWDGAGNSFCVDLAPAKGGAAGQVILLDHESGDRPRIAGSLAGFFELIAAAWEEQAD